MRALRFPVVCLVGGLLLLASACTVKKEADPADIELDVEFPSVAAAVAVDSVKMYVFAGSLACTDLVRKRQTDQALPDTVIERPVSPCDLQAGRNNALELDLRSTFTILAVGQAAGADLLVGCSVQTDFGTTRALPVSLTFIDASKRIPDTACARLSDKCNGACQ
jgi:hypothetical protein